LNIINPPPKELIVATDKEATAFSITGFTFVIKDMFEDYFLRPLTFNTPTYNNGSSLPSYITYDNITTTLFFPADLLYADQFVISATTPTSATHYQRFTVNIFNNPPEVLITLSNLEHFENTTYTFSQDMTTLFKENDINQNISSYSVAVKPTFLSLSTSGTGYSLRFS
jgi:hypothetical protein